jgi:hypothetical protein
MVDAKLQDVRVEETSEQLKYKSGRHFWDWVDAVEKGVEEPSEQ